MINLIGLSTGLACAFLCFLWISDELSVDKFHDNEGQIFQVMHNIPRPDDTLTVKSTPGLLAESLKQDYPEVEYATSVLSPDWFDNEKGIINFNDQYLQAKGQFVQPDYLKIFSWELTQGTLEDFSAKKNAVFISEELGKNLFGSLENVIGKVVDWDQEDTAGSFEVVGVFKSPPLNSTVQFDLLFNYQFFYEGHKKNLDHWGNSNPNTYLTLKAGTDKIAFGKKIKDFIRRKFEAANGVKNLHYIGTLFIRQYSDGYLYNSYENGQLSGGRIGYVKLFSAIAIFIVFIASINFINLTTARASRRAKEIGIKKTMGAKRSSLVLQFLVESILVSVFSLIIALVLVYLLLPSFNLLTAKQMVLSWDMVLILISIALLVGLLSGLYPAFYLSHFKPMNVLKGKILTNNANGLSENMVRKSLVVFQFAISIILIIGVVVVYEQVELIQTKNLGYNDDYIISLKSSGKVYDDMPTFVNEVKNIPGVLDASSFGHDMVGDVGSTSGVDWPGRLPEERLRFGNLEVGSNWIELLEIKLLEGRSFSNNYTTEDGSIIFNESAIKAMGLTDPIGKIVKIWGEERQIIGVVEDFNFESLYDEVMPCFIQNYPDLNSVLIKIDPDSTASTLAALEDFHNEYNGGLPFDYSFMDEDYQQLYIAEQRVAKLSKYFAVIAILISCLGLLALSAFTAERRQKEIGIRKVLGSSVFEIVKLLSSDFIKLVITAMVIAIPISFFFADEWLSSFAYRVNLSWWWFVISGLIAFTIALITISLQTIRAANLNPILCLKEE